MTTAVQAIRSGIRQAAAVLAQDQATSSRPEAFTYVPPTHARALDLDATLIEGIRGAGKSFWFSLLASPKHLSFVRASFPEARLPQSVQVAQGFGMGLSIAQAPDADTLAALMDNNFRERSIWRAVIAHHAQVDGPFAKLKEWTARVHWVQQNPEAFARGLEAADQRLGAKGETLLVLFDALDRMADDWQHINKLAKGLLQEALNMRSMRSIRCKVFVRPDLLQDPAVTSFADYSKLLATKASLVWHRADLYALLYQCLGNAPVSRKHFAAWAERGKSTAAAGDWAVPSNLRKDEDRQEALFERIAGKAMGSSVKRGKPYTWLVNHLQDGLNQVSPRSFLAALGKAASETEEDYALPLDYRGIQRGVQEASQIRVQEITEDYPWVGRVMEPLRGNLTVPCTAAEIEKLWKANQTLDQLEALLKRGKAAVNLPPQNLEQGPSGILLDLEALGMVQRMEGKRVQMPDVFRVAFGFGRRGGVTPLK
ncbi:hypothetical protein GCM10007320_24610 [Pseudorhodoferax aquiterrae]|uniref:AAA domain-containing protein n=1 Tax=Pseudorhodoferax aquiterrae TaxID=747304 RepID=A0ABQ3G1K4_9BURK|nr:hypothetical protein [Pseudorhodoferax aquiterrae]GHC81885.1 hypothetical protein GCM10007320_24610 [Pseudorhodoferax aquiterrae]